MPKKLKSLFSKDLLYFAKQDQHTVLHYRNKGKKWYDMMSGQTQVWLDMYVFCSDTIFLQI